MAIFDLGMKPLVVATEINLAVADWCKKNKPELNVSFNGVALRFDSKGKSEDEILQIKAFLGNISLKEAQRLGLSTVVDIFTEI